MKEADRTKYRQYCYRAVSAGPWLAWSVFLVARRHSLSRLNTLPLVFFVVALAAGCGRSGASEDKEKLRIEAALVGTWITPEDNQFYSFGAKGVIFGYGIYQVDGTNAGKTWNLLENPGDEKYEVDTSENAFLLKWITKGKSPRISRIISLAGTNAMITSASEDASLTGKTSAWMRVSSDPTFLSPK